MTKGVGDKQEAPPSQIIEWSEDGQPMSVQFGDVYFSRENGLAESRYVFLEKNQLEQRFKTLKDSGSFVIGETGFGTGLNFLSCWQLWQEHAPNTAQLTFISTEKYPLSPENLKRALALWPSLSILINKLLHAYDMHFTSTNIPQYKTLTFGNIRLILLINDAELGFKELLHQPLGATYEAIIAEEPVKDLSAIKPLWLGVDAWFLDGFAPSKNPEMWTPSLYKTIALLSKKGTSFSTFTAASNVRRGLIDAGFNIVKWPGFGRKREMLSGVFEPCHQKADKPQNSADQPTPKNTTTNKKTRRSSSAKNLTPWAVIDNYQPLQPQQSVAIIGGGLAGCHSAYALAKRGFNVTIIDRQDKLASEASGNPQGVLYAKLSPHAQTLSDFNLDALLYSQYFYQDYWQQTKQGERCGVLQLSYNDKAEKNHQGIYERFPSTKSIQFVDKEQASHLANISLNTGALYLPYSGWLSPQLLCQWLCTHKQITVINNTVIHSLNQCRDSKKWSLVGTTLDENQQTYEHRFDQVIVANANDAKGFDQTRWLPTQSVRGQISYLETQAPLDQLQTVICAEGYIPPATAMTINNTTKQIHALGASFNLKCIDKELRDIDHQSNLANTTKHFNGFSEETSSSLASNIHSGRVGFRCTSPDYLPLAGPAPIYPAFEETYQALSFNAKTVVPSAGPYFSGLYVNIAHGSRGLAYTPLVAELIACTMAGQPLPMSQTMANSLNPARFIIRDLMRRNH